MMLPTELVALAEARRDAFEQEMRLRRQLSELPPVPMRWRQWTGESMMWAGAKLVRWGEGVAMVACSRNVEMVN